MNTVDLIAQIEDPETSEAELVQLAREHFLFQADAPPRAVQVARLSSVKQRLLDDIPNHSDADAWFFSAFNDRAQQDRERRFWARVRDPDFRGHVVVAEGDSWFQYPYIKTDIIDHLSARPELAIRCRSAAGDWLRQMVDDLPGTLDAIEAVEARALLLSGGGNDLVGNPGLGHLVRRHRPGEPASYYIGDDARRRLDDMAEMYRYIVSTVHKRFPGLPILCHGYAHSVPGKQRWMGWVARSLERDARIEDPSLQAAIVHHMIDRFNDSLIALSQADPDVHYIDCRALIQPELSHWFDEIHPTDEKWAAVADAFADRLRTVLG